MVGPTSYADGTELQAGQTVKRQLSCNTPQSAVGPKTVCIYLGFTEGLCQEASGQKKQVSNSPAVVGISEAVLSHLREHPDLMRELAILSIDDDGVGFVADGTDVNGEKFEKHFKLTPGEQCVVYRKTGSDAMGHTKPLQQFVSDAELHEPPIVEGARLRVDSNLTASLIKEAIDSGGSNSSIGSVTAEPPETSFGDSTEDDSFVQEHVFYSLEELTDPCLWKRKPDIAERPDEREQFLAPSVFETVFGMTKEDFAKLPKWKMSNLKKERMLF